MTRRSIFVAFDPATTTLLELQRAVEAQSGVAVEWMRLMSGGGRVLEAPSNGSSDESSGGAGACLLADLGIRGGVNLFLTARVEGMQYGRG